MSSLSKMLTILDLFDLDRPSWSSEEIMESMGFSRPTTFRYLKELRQAGLLARFGGRYVLGAKAVKLDFIIRQTDPLLKLFQPIMIELRDHTDCDVILASLLGEDLFATIHEISGATNVSWPRGRPMPLTRGAGGLAILASLSQPQLRRILASPSVAATIDDAAALKKSLSEIAKQGYAISLGALEASNVGIAVPIKLSGVPPAALIMVMSKKHFGIADRTVIIRLLNEARANMLRAYAKSNGEDVATSSAEIDA